LFVLFSCSLVAALPSLSKIYSVWHCADDSCLWANPPSSDQTWLINRGDGNPTVNVVIFAFIDPLQLLQGKIPAGFAAQASYFKSHNLYVIFSIGGADWASHWDQALTQDAAGLARNAANIAKQYGVGIEIDYEQDSSGSMGLLTTFVQTYRSIIPFDGSDSPAPQSILTVDLGAGTGYLSAISQTTGNWLSAGLVNWANAMVAGDPNGDETQYWQQHLNGASWANIAPINPKYLVGSLYASSGANDCASYAAPLPNSVSWAKQNNVRGLSFWAVGCPAGPNQCANNCPGIQQGSKAFLG